MQASCLRNSASNRANCLPAHDTPASVIEYFQKFNKPLPEQFCAKEAAPQASHEPPQEHGPGDGPFAQYEGDQGGGYDSDQGGGYERDREGDYERDQGGGSERDQGGGYDSE